MKTYTLDDIRGLEPCYDPAKYAPEDWSGTLVDILRAEAVPAEDRIWVVTGFLDDRTNRLFAVWCARQALKLVENPDPRSINACDVAERFANGEATAEELYAAWDAAWAAAWDAARDAAWAAAWAADRDPAWAAAWAAARAAAWDADMVAAWDADMVAAWAAARAAALDAARDAQINHLIEMIEASDAAL